MALWGKSKINLGDEVRDPYTGFQGVAMARHTYLHGCNRISVQPKTKKDGILPDASSFDEPQLELVKSEVVPEGDRTVGGSEKYIPKPK